VTKSSAQRSAATKERIQKATVELVQEIGWRQVTTRRIAERAGVNQALVHYHFGTVDALLRQAVIAELDQQMAEPIEQMLTSDTPGEGIRRLSDWLRAVDPSSSMAVLSAEVLAFATRDEAVREWMAGLLDTVRTQMSRSIEAAQADGTVRADVSAAGVAVVVAAIIDGLIVHVLVDPNLRLDDVADTLHTLLAAAPTQGGN